MSRLTEIEERMSAIAAEVEQDGADLDALETEVQALKEERKGILDAAEKRKALLADITDGKTGTVVRAFPEDKKEERTYGADSPEYRSAFLKTMLNKDLTDVEQRAYTHTTSNTSAVLPTTMLNQIWDLVSQQHAIMGDITIYRTGTILELVKHTEIKAGKAAKTNESTAATDEQNTFVKVSLSGNDFAKTVTVSYAMAEMSIDALESYLINEISTNIGEALADDVISTVKDDINTANKITSAATELAYKDVAKAFGLLKRASNVNVYVNYATLYNQIVSMVDTTGRPIYQPSAQAGANGVLLGGTVKVEESMSDGEILIGDSRKVVYNMVKDIMVETDRDIKTHNIIYSGYARGEGALIDDKAFTLLTMKTASAG